MTEHSPKQWFNLEEKFFAEVDQELMASLRHDLSTRKAAESIMRVTGIANDSLAQEIAGLDVTVETLAAFRLVPLIAVAWADDRIDENERYVILEAAEKSGIKSDEPAMQLLKGWTRKRPSSELFDAWCDYAKALGESLNGELRDALQKEIVKQVEGVAEAAGGLLGFGSVSPNEKKMIARIKAALD